MTVGTVHQLIGAIRRVSDAVSTSWFCFVALGVQEILSATCLLIPCLDRGSKITNNRILRRWLREEISTGQKQDDPVKNTTRTWVGISQPWLFVPYTAGIHGETVGRPLLFYAMRCERSKKFRRPVHQSLSNPGYIYIDRPWRRGRWEKASN